MKMQLLLALPLLAGCTNSILPSGQSQFSGTLTSASPTPTSSSSSKIDQINISTINIASPTTTTTTTSTPPVTSIYFNASTSTALISSHCTSGSNNGLNQKPCSCKFSWIEINPNAGMSSSITRTVQTPVTSVQPNFVTCSAPSVYLSEIVTGTQIAITVIPALNNPDGTQFKVSSSVFTTGNTSITGSFQDSTGHIFDNILHYSCYEKFKRGMSVTSQASTQTNSTTSATATVWLASKFCVSKTSANGTTTATASCPNLSPPDYSAQANYYNLFIRNTELGDISQFNDGYICPYIKESLNSSLTNQAWPLDSTFALSIGPTSTFSVGVEANTKLSTGGNDPTAVSSTCSATTATTTPTAASTSTNSLLQSCLGFAAPVNSNGTCPYFTSASGQIRFTYRLRRYVAIYPRVFDTDGHISPAIPTQGIDTIYVLDRPVQAPASSNPLQPYTMRGPKPCPSAYFDSKGVTGATGYLSTSSSNWNNKNVDGIEFPNLDKNDPIAGSCSAALPVLDTTKTFFSILTVNSTTNSKFQHQYIRPQQGWTPHYEEDTNFQACAPQALPLVDAPLHFSRDATKQNVAWCTEGYPTQNTNIASLDPTASGTIAPYTSHVAKNSASIPCTATPLTIPTVKYTYPAVSLPAIPAYALHKAVTPWPIGATTHANVTCDRTVLTQGLNWTKYPLLAPEADLEAAISLDSSYYCSMTYDNNGPKTSKLAASTVMTTPTTGCCNAASVTVPAAAVGNPPPGAHLEPINPCQPPSY